MSKIKLEPKIFDWKNKKTKDGWNQLVWRHKKNESEGGIYCPYCQFCCHVLALHLFYAHGIKSSDFKKQNLLTARARMTSLKSHIKRSNENLKRIEAGIIGPRKKILTDRFEGANGENSKA